MPPIETTYRTVHYNIHDNGGTPFKVCAIRDADDILLSVAVYKQGTEPHTFLHQRPGDDEGDADEDSDEDEDINQRYDDLVVKYENPLEIFVDGSVDDFEDDYKDDYKDYADDVQDQVVPGIDLSPGPDPLDEPGNTMLVDIGSAAHQDSFLYLWIGERVVTFTTLEPFDDYHSFIGNNDVPYPIGLTEKYVYFFAPCLPVRHRNLATDDDDGSSELEDAQIQGSDLEDDRHDVMRLDDYDIFAGGPCHGPIYVPKSAFSPPVTPDNFRRRHHELYESFYGLTDVNDDGLQVTHGRRAENVQLIHRRIC